MSFFITIEGSEGCGKSTQLQRLLEHLQAQGRKAVATREPGGCPLSEAVRTLLLNPDHENMAPQAELLLYCAARAQHVEEFIRPALREGKIVLCDRFSDATTAYQGAGRGLDIMQLETITDFATGGLTPDMTLFLDYPVEAGLVRAITRNQVENLESEGRFEMESLAFHQRIHQAYLKLAASHQRFHMIDARGDADIVAKRIIQVVDNFLASRKAL